jgi:hypothetical protein
MGGIISVGIGRADLLKSIPGAGPAWGNSQRVDRAQGVELASPLSLALDSQGGTLRLYIADTGNHRILGWADTRTISWRCLWLEKHA